MKKMNSDVLAERVEKIFEEWGATSYEFARKEILSAKIECKPLQDAFLYFLQELQYNVHHPALLSLACKAVNGEDEKTTAIGAALVLLSGAAHIHDDVIDLSGTKESKLTVFGKFGKDIAILLGDVFLFKGLTILYKTCQSLPEKQGNVITKLVEKALFEISTAEIKETSLRRNWNITPKECLLMLRNKAAVPELATRVGAILGKGSANEIEALGKYGRTFGLLLAIREEFINVFEPEELENRAENECLPLPILYAFRNRKARKKIEKVLMKKELTKNDISRILGYLKEVREIRELTTEIQRLFKEGTNAISIIENRNISNILTLILQATIVDLNI
jgi:geranylgeranyl pyrophosphate synthase